MTRLGNIGFRRADHLRWRKGDPTRDQTRGEPFTDNHMVPVRAEDCRDENGVITMVATKTAPILPNLRVLSAAVGFNVTAGPWKERFTGYGVRWTRTLYLVENGNVFTGTERRNNPPAED